MLVEDHTNFNRFSNLNLWLVFLDEDFNVAILGLIEANWHVIHSSEFSRNDKSASVI